MYRKMLVLMDGSELAEVVFEYARELSGRLGMDLDLLHVATPEEEDQLPMRQAYIESQAKILCEEAQALNSGLARSTGSGGGADGVSQDIDTCIEAKGTVAVGHPVDEIIKYIDENDIDLVMLSTRGKSGFRVWDIGSVATQVIHASKVPIWLVPAELHEEIVRDTGPERPILIPLSGSEVSEAVIPYVLDIVGQRGAEVELVLANAVEAPYLIYSRSFLEIGDKEKAEVKEYLEKVAEPLRAQGLKVRTEVLVGEQAEAIIKFVKDEQPQLVAMATRGRRGLSKMVFGSVAEEVIHMIKKTPMLLASGIPGGERE